MCRDSFRWFVNAFPRAVLRDFPNVYCIASTGSVTSPEEYVRFCRTLGLSFSQIDLETYTTQIMNCVVGLLCSEAVCDVDILRSIFRHELESRKNTRIVCSTEIGRIQKKDGTFRLTAEDGSVICADVVLNCSYADINRLTSQLGYPVPERQYEYTVVPIVELDMPAQGITVIDGPFMTLLPYGKTGRFTLYHVMHSVIEAEVTKTMSRRWTDPGSSPFYRANKEHLFERIRSACATFVPELRRARLCGFLHAPRMVLAHHEEDDARPSLLEDYGDGYMTVFSGKIDHILSIVESVCASLDVSRIRWLMFAGNLLFRRVRGNGFFGHEDRKSEELSSGKRAEAASFEAPTGLNCLRNECLICRSVASGK